jgi:hypothetical protein
MRGWRKPRREVFGVEPAMNDEARMTNDEGMTKHEWNDETAERSSVAALYERRSPFWERTLSLSGSDTGCCIGRCQHASGVCSPEIE